MFSKTNILSLLVLLLVIIACHYFSCWGRKKKNQTAMPEDEMENASMEEDDMKGMENGLEKDMETEEGMEKDMETRASSSTARHSSVSFSRCNYFNN
jgi:hypothetical protein